MRTRIRSPLAACVVAASALTALGGSVTYTFDTDPATALTVRQEGFADSGGIQHYWGETGGNPGGFLGLCWPVGGSSSIIVFPDIDAGQIVSAFKLEADLRIGNPQQSDRAADGFSISFARANDDVFANPVSGSFATAGAVETGTKTGLSISFDTWAGNALPDTADIEGLIVRVDNVTVNKTSVPTRNGACDDNTSLQTGPRDLQYWQNNPVPDSAFVAQSWSNLCWQRLSVELDTNSQLTVIWKGRTILDHYQAAFFPSAGGIVLAGRTGGADEHTHFDNLTLTTVAAPADTTPPTAPANLRAQVTGAYRVVLAWDPSTDDSFRVAYEIERNGTQLAGQFVNATNEFRGLTASTAYQYRVRATDVSGNKSAWTPLLNLTTAADVNAPAYAGAKIYSDGETGLGTAVTALLLNPIYPASPTSIGRLNDIVMSFGEPNFGETFGDNLGVRIAGTITPPVSGQYNFFVRSDDYSEVYLNTTGATIPDADGFSAIAAESATCCEAFKEQTTPPTDQPFETTTVPVQLTAGQKYGILYITKEGGGGDWGQVAWRLVGDTTAAASLQPIRFPYFESESIPKADPVGAEVTITAQPQSQTVVANTTVTFSVAATFASPYATAPVYHWYKNNLPVATGTNYTLPYVSTSENGAKIKVVVAVPGKEVTSDEATLTVNTDNVPPTLDVAGIHGSQDLTHVTVKFSEPVTDPTAITAANYTMQPALAVTAATRVDQTTVLLTTAAQTPNTRYTLTVNNVRDNAANAIAANSTIEWMSWVVVGTVGPVTIQIYDGAGGATAGAVTGTAVSALTSYAGYPASPDVTQTITAFNSRLLYPDDTHENYGGRMTGLITPTETGSYRFFISSDDSSELWMNKTGTTEGGLEKIAEETGCCNAFTEPNSARTSVAIPLTGGTQYMLRGLWKEGGGGDYMTIAWRKEGNPQPAASLQPIPAAYDPWAGTPYITTQPMGAAVDPGATATFTVAAELGARPVRYQWQRLSGNSGVWADLVGETASTLSVPNVTASSVAAYRCVASNSAGSAASYGAVLTVKNSFVIEAEDFNYEGGKHMAASDTMPYGTLAYRDLGAVYQVDYNSDNGFDSNSYRSRNKVVGGVTVTNFVDGHNVNQNDGLAGYNDRGGWVTTSNYKLGWTGGGKWQNYTRQIPAGSYLVYAALSNGDTAGNAGGTKGTLGLVAGDVATTNQTFTSLGVFSGQATGGWGNNALIPMQGPTTNGVSQVVALGGLQTLRFYPENGDFDWFMLVPAAAQGPTITKIVANPNGTLTVEWTGAGVLEATESLSAPNWQTVAATSPATLTVPVGTKTLFGRVKQ